MHISTYINLESVGGCVFNYDTNSTCCKKPLTNIIVTLCRLLNSCNSPKKFTLRDLANLAWSNSDKWAAG